MTSMLAAQQRANPKILLDSGDVCWGCEVWWGPEPEMQAKLAEAKLIVNCSIKEARKGNVPQVKMNGDDFFGAAPAKKDDTFWS